MSYLPVLPLYLAVLLRADVRPLGRQCRLDLADKVGADHVVLQLPVLVLRRRHERADHADMARLGHDPGALRHLDFFIHVQLARL